MLATGGSSEVKAREVTPNSVIQKFILKRSGDVDADMNDAKAAGEISTEPRRIAKELAVASALQRDDYSTLPELQPIDNMSADQANSASTGLRVGASTMETAALPRSLPYDPFDDGRVDEGDEDLPKLISIEGAPRVKVMKSTSLDHQRELADAEAVGNME